MADHYDIVFVGGGIAGSAAAAVLGHRCRVALIDMHAVYPPDIRADKVAGDQIGLMDRLGLLDVLKTRAARTGSIARVQDGRIVEFAPVEEYGLQYDVLVNGVRDVIPNSVRRVVGKVANIEADDDLARIALSSGDTLSARLVVLATGLGDSLRRQIGISRHVVRAAHSVSIVFDLVRADPTPMRADALISYGRSPDDKIDYLHVFPFPTATRANLFVYHPPRDPWLSAFAADPQRKLLEAFPGLDRQLGQFEVTSRVHMRPMDLYETRGYRRANVVLIGDAFRTGCPAVGSGLSRALTEVEALARLAPGWLATPGMGE